MSNEPTPEEIHRYAVAWGESEVVHLTDWRYWEQMYNAALEVIRRQAVTIGIFEDVLEEIGKLAASRKRDTDA